MMLMIRLTCTAVTLVLLIQGPVRARELPRAQPEELDFSAERLSYIDEFYGDKVKKGEMAGIVTLIARHGKIAHFSAIGYADVERKQKLQTDTIFRLYSMTKPIASTALMMLYEEGRFQLGDPVSKYIPEFTSLRVLRKPDAALDDTVPLERPPTVQDLMRHTAGFMHGGDQNAVDKEYVKANVFGVDVSLTEMMTKIAKIPLAYQPGTKFAYSVGPDVQARLVEIFSGMPFDEFLQKRLFGPLGMRDTAFWLSTNKASRLTKVHWDKSGKLTPLDEAHGYPKKSGFLAEPWSVNSYTVNHRRKGGSYGLVGTAEDYWRFAQMMLNGGELEGVRVLSPEVVRFMTRDHMNGIEIDGPDGRPNGLGWGLGFAIMKDPAAAGYMSSEGTFFWAGAAGTQFWVDPKEDLVLVAMIQHMGTPATESFWAQIRTLVYSALMQ
jgi:CubicO group peptidase (beta-lactamase class C family)